LTLAATIWEVAASRAGPAARQVRGWVRQAALIAAIAAAVVLGGGALLVGPRAGAAAADPLAQQAPKGERQDRRDR
jgi:hypothetical protein